VTAEIQDRVIDLSRGIGKAGPFLGPDDGADAAPIRRRYGLAVASTTWRYKPQLNQMHGGGGRMSDADAKPNPGLSPEQQSVILKAAKVARELRKGSPKDDVEGHAFEGDDDAMRAVSINNACLCA
jgi:hypothetical protein